MVLANEDVEALTGSCSYTNEETLQEEIMLNCKVFSLEGFEGNDFHENIFFIKKNQFIKYN